MFKVVGVFLITLSLLGQTHTKVPKISREDFSVISDNNIRIFVREVRTTDSDAKKKVPVLLLHGARVPGIPSFDLLVPGGSLAADLAAAGHTIYIMDARGYGRSTRPSEMDQPPENNPPLVRSSEVVRDVAAVVETIRQRLNVKRVALLGWATGGHWMGHYTSIYTDRISHLILYNSLYGATPTHPTLGRGSDLEDPQHPGQFHRAKYGAYRFNTVDSVFAGWDRNIPIEDKSLWRDPVVATALRQATLDSDTTSSQRNPATFRAPTGALEDSFYLATGRQLWDASLIRARTLILRSERDFWTRPEDPKQLAEHLVYAAQVRTVTIPEATHFVHLDRAERGRERFLQEVLSFLAESN
ncbi:MAG: alpha/beta fold hydrolase [Acidobacteriota bacterium]